MRTIKVVYWAIMGLVVLMVVGIVTSATYEVAYLFAHPEVIGEWVGRVTAGFDAGRL